jgi:hypothetical protein
MHVPRTIRIFAVAVAALALSSCSKSSLEAPSATVKDPVFASAGAPYDTVVTPVGPLIGSVTIDGAVGGKLAVGAYRIEVPRGAFKGTATITLTQSDPAVLQCDLDISPTSANQFAVPVTLVARLSNTTDLIISHNVWLDPSASVWRLIPSVPDLAKTELRSDLWHFSKYGTCRAGW